MLKLLKLTVKNVEQVENIMMRKTGKLLIIPSLVIFGHARQVNAFRLEFTASWLRLSSVI